jgi:hypothetical protein
MPEFSMAIELEGIFVMNFVVENGTSCIMLGDMGTLHYM